MLSPKNSKKVAETAKNSGLSPSKEKELSPNSRRQLHFKPKTLSDLRSVSPNSKKSNSPFNKHERSFSTLYSKLMGHKTYS